MEKDLSKLSAEELGLLFPIKIEKYNTDWPTIFQEEKKTIAQKFDSKIIERISHIGSTAIPGIKAKPTIDILIEVAKHFDKENFIQSFQKIGYYYIPQPENPPPHMMFAKGYSPSGFKGQAYHVHIRFKADWDEIIFRDYLIEHPETAKHYETLKVELAQKHKNNREDYTNAKTEFIQEIMKLAKK